MHIRNFSIAVRAMIFALCLVFGSGLTTTSFAQDITISQDIALKQDQGYLLIGRYKDRILVFRADGNKFEVHGYNDDLQSHWERELQLEKQSAEVITVVPEDTAFHVIYGYKHKGDYYLKHRVYSPSVVLIDSTTLEVVDKLYFTPKFVAFASEDYTKVLLARTDREQDLTMKSYDVTTREELWKKQIVFDGISYRRDFRDALVTNDGDLYLIMDHEKNSRRFREFTVISVDADSRGLKKKNLTLGDFIAHDLEVAYDNMNTNLILTGLYNNKYSGKSLGIFKFSLDHESRGVDFQTIPFSAEILEEVSTKKSDSGKGVADFLVKDIIFRHDGGLVLLIEKHKEYSRRPNVPIRGADLGPSGWVDYYFEDVMVYSIHPDGEVHWKTVLHKKQYSQDDNGMYSSYFVFKTPGMLRLLYNDEIRNESTVSEYVIRGNGYHKRRSVFNTDYQRLGLRFRDAIQIAYNECIVPSENNNRLNLVRIKFDESD